MGIAFKVENLRFRYPSSKEDTIKGISFDIREGEVFGFLGPSGAGKSTTQKILIKLLEDYAGNIEYFGKNLKALDKSFYEEIGVGFEMPVHFTKLTALENMKFFSGFYRQTANIQDLMERVGLWDYRDVKVGEFSKGMKVRLNFVRALLNKPRVLFLDEVTNGVDPRNARIIKDMIAEFRDRGGTVFLTTHLMNDVEELWAILKSGWGLLRVGRQQMNANDKGIPGPHIEEILFTVGGSGDTPCVASPLGGKNTRCSTLRILKSIWSIFLGRYINEIERKVCEC
ncbi:MAG: ABC transporter ATP-binding protein [Bacillota bacterium]